MRSRVAKKAASSFRVGPSPSCSSAAISFSPRARSPSRRCQLAAAWRSQTFGAAPARASAPTSNARSIQTAAASISPTRARLRASSRMIAVLLTESGHAHRSSAKRRSEASTRPCVPSCSARANRGSNPIVCPSTGTRRSGREQSPTLGAASTVARSRGLPSVTAPCSAQALAIRLFRPPATTMMMITVEMPRLSGQLRYETTVFVFGDVTRSRNRTLHWP